MKMQCNVLVAFACGLYLAATGALADETAAPTGSVETGISFARGKWDTNRWTAVRMANQDKAVSLTQFADSIGTTTNTFSRADYGKERDNTLLVNDTGLTDGQVEVTFSMGPGLRDANAHSTPGMCISPKIKDGVFESGIAVFVATSAIVVWYEYTEGDRVRYVHLGQLARWTDPSKKHVLRYRFSQKARNLAIQLDDSDVMVFQFVGDSRLSYIPHELNSLVALWGCHGACAFHEMKVRSPGTIPFLVREPQP